MRSAFLTCLVLAWATPAFAETPKFAPPPAEKIAGLFEFSGPVTLTLRVVPIDQPNRRPKQGVPLAVYSYSDPAHTSQSISIAIYPLGEFFKDRRDKLNSSPSVRKSITPDRRMIFQFLAGFGPGGEAEAALLACRDPRFEIVLIQQTNYHDDEDPKAYAHHATPGRQLAEIIAAIEALILP